MSKYCADCGAENRDTARFCQMCAQPLTDGSSGAICNRCGRANRISARFCQACGASLAGPAAHSASSPLGSLTGMLPSNMILKGRYIIIARVGQGGMGAVYKATDSRENRLVAVKELSESNAATQQERDEARASFRREAEMLARLKHNNLPRVYDFFENGSKQYLVMDFVNGETLEESLNRSPNGLPVDSVLKIADQLCDVLDYLHSQKKPIIFRDLKPGNIMIDGRGDVKLIDFGIARKFASGKSSDTIALGTTGYAPREQYGKGQTDARSDVYALGATLHHLLTGIDPTDNPFVFVSPRSVRAGVPVEVDLAIMKAVEQDPERRWQTARMMKQALRGAKAKPKPQFAPIYAPSKPIAVPAQAPPAAGATPRSAVAPPAPAKSSTRTASQPTVSHGPMGFWPALSVGLLIGVIVTLGREVWGWSPQPGDFIASIVWPSIFWFTGTFAYAVTRRSVAASGAWVVAPLWAYSGTDLEPLLIPVLMGGLLGWLMARGKRHLTYSTFLSATVFTMLAEQIALVYFYTVPFRWEEVAGAVIGGSVAFVVGWAFRR